MIFKFFHLSSGIRLGKRREGGHRIGEPDNAEWHRLQIERKIEN